MTLTPPHSSTPPAYAAQALEEQAAAALQAAELPTAARCLAEASTLWARQGEWLRQGSSGLLAASTWRAVGDLAQAENQLAVLAASPLPPKLARAVLLEACEQHLAAGRARDALRGFNEFWARFQNLLELEQRPLILQRRAAAAVAAQAWGVAVEDLTHAAALLQGADAEACRLAAVSAQLQLNATAALQLWRQVVNASVPADGGAAVRRGLAGAAIGEKLGDTALALQCLDDARQGALDAADPASYALCAQRATQLVLAQGDTAGAYARLATAWATLRDAIGPQAAQAACQPALQSLREQVGDGAFLAAEALYEARRKA